MLTKEMVMQLAFATLGCPDWDLETIAQQAAALGFDGVELRGANGKHIGVDDGPAVRRQAREACATAGVAIACVMGYTRFALLDSAARQEQVDLTRRYLDLCVDLGCPTLRIFGGQVEGDDRDAGRAALVESLRELAPVAEQAGVTLALETHDDWCRGAEVRAVLDAVDSPVVGACWDVGNSWFVEPPATTATALGARVRHVHFKDAARTAGGVESRLPGTGEVDLAGALHALRGGGYDGWLSFEWEKMWEPDLASPEQAFPVWLELTRRLLAETD
jgi:sugar phosphate isomerase/epimerase